MRVGRSVCAEPLPVAGRDSPSTAMIVLAVVDRVRRRHITSLRREQTMTRGRPGASGADWRALLAGVTSW